MNVAAKVAFAATLAIALATTSVFILGLTLTGATPLLLMGSVLATPLLMIGSGMAAKESAKAAKLAQDEKEIGLALEEFKALDQDQFSMVCSQLSIDPNSAYSNEEFDILVARLAYWSKQAKATHEKANRHLYSDYPESEIQKVDASNAALELTSSLRYETRDVGFRILENEAIPAMLQSALILQVLRDTAQAAHLEAIGKLYPKSIGVRLSELLFDKNDTYMTFHDTTRPPLTREEIINLFYNGVPALQQRMFA